VRERGVQHPAQEESALRARNGGGRVDRGVGLVPPVVVPPRLGDLLVGNGGPNLRRRAFSIGLVRADPSTTHTSTVLLPPYALPVTLTEFLHARLDEDEATASAELPRHGPGSPDPNDRPQAGALERTFTPTRLLAEIESKRLLIRLAYEATGLDMDKDLDRAVDARETSGVEFVGERMLRALALPYADHADFDEDWRA